MKEWHIPPKEALPKPPLLFFLLEPDDEHDTSYFAPLVKMVNLFSSIIPTFYYAENEKSNKCSCFTKNKRLPYFTKNAAVNRRKTGKTKFAKIFSQVVVTPKQVYSIKNGRGDRPLKINVLRNQFFRIKGMAFCAINAANTESNTSFGRYKRLYAPRAYKRLERPLYTNTHIRAK